MSIDSEGLVEPAEGPDRPLSVLDSGTPESPWRCLRRRLWILVGVVGALFVVLTAMGHSPAPATAPLTVKGGGAAKAFELKNLHQGGPAVSLSQYRGRPVVVNFFASWCVPCRREMPGFEAGYERMQDRVAFLGNDHRVPRRLDH